MQTTTKAALILGILFCTGLAACGTDEGVNLLSDDSEQSLELEIVPGEHYRHALKIAPLITVRNPPQMAVWIEDPESGYRETLFVTEKIATKTWRQAPGDSAAEGISRPEALPVWIHRNATNPVDGVSSASPKRGIDLRRPVGGQSRKIVVYLEVNHSTDFNPAYPADASVTSPAYSGGPWGSGQPSLVYRAEVDLREPGFETILEAVGTGDPDGSDGEIRLGFSGIDSALKILERATVRVSPAG